MTNLNPAAKAALENARNKTNGEFGERRHTAPDITLDPAPLRAPRPSDETKAARGPGGPSGQPTAHAETTAAAGHTPTPRTVDTADGTMTVTPGVLDANAIEVFTAGQCVAISVALAEHYGLDEVVVAVHTGENRVLHAWVAPFGRFDDEVVDVCGVINQEELWDDFDNNYGEEDTDELVLSLAEARDMVATGYSGGLPDQDYELAALFVAPVADLVDRKTNWMADQYRRS